MNSRERKGGAIASYLCLGRNTGVYKALQINSILK